MEVPTPIPFTVGTSTIDIDKTIEYPGTWHSFPHKIRITGPIDDAVITNVTTGEKLDFTGDSIAATHYYDIDLRYGYKTVLLDGITDKVAELTDDSDLATWHIAAASNAATTMTNVINVSGSAATSATSVGISYYVRYLGI